MNHLKRIRVNKIDNSHCNFYLKFSNSSHSYIIIVCMLHVLKWQIYFKIRLLANLIFDVIKAYLMQDLYHTMNKWITRMHQQLKRKVLIDAIVVGLAAIYFVKLLTFSVFASICKLISNNFVTLTGKITLITQVR